MRTRSPVSTKTTQAIREVSRVNLTPSYVLLPCLRGMIDRINTMENKYVCNQLQFKTNNNHMEKQQNVNEVRQDGILSENITHIIVFSYKFPSYL